MGSENVLYWCAVKPYLQRRRLLTWPSNAQIFLMLFVESRRVEPVVVAAVPRNKRPIGSLTTV